MCPSYLATRDEKDSTRGRARVLQELANGSLVKGFRADEVAEALDLCLSCKGCSSDCPAGVDMATYKAEVLHQRYRRRLRPPAHYALGWLPRWARLAVAGAAAGQRGAAPPHAGRAGQAGRRHRRAPPAAARSPPQTFRAWFADAGRRAGHARSLLWVDTFTDHFTPEVGQAAVRVLRGRRLLRAASPTKPVCCGLTWISTGQLDGARKQLRAHPGRARPARARRHADRRARTVVHRGAAPRRCSSCCPTTRARPQVAAATRTLAELLRGDRRAGRRRALAGVRAVAQPHCHQHAVHGLGGRRRAAAPAPAPTSRRSAAAAGWPATSASSAGTTTCRWRWPRPRCCRRSAPRAARRGGAGRRVLLPHPARAARPGAQRPPGPAARRPPAPRPARPERRPATRREERP